MALRVEPIPDLPANRLADPRAWVAALGIAVVGLSGLIVRDLYFPASSSVAPPRTVTVGLGTVRNAVSGTGNVVPSSQQFVTFKVAGQLTEVDVKVGDKVTQGQVLAKLDASTLQAAVDTASGNLATAQANLDSVNNPVTPEQFAQLQHNLANAQQSYNDTAAGVNLTNQQDASNVAADQQQLAADQAAYNADQQALNTNPVYQYDKAKLASDQAKYSSDGCSPSASSALCTADAAAISADQQKVNQDPALFAPNSNSDQQKVNTDNAKLTSDTARQQTDSAAGQRSLDQAQNAITSAQDAINSQSAIKPSALAVAQAALANAQTALNSAIQNLGYAVLSAPAAGVVLAINGQPGESVGTSTGVTAQSPGSVAPLTSTTAGTAFMVLSSAGTFQAQAPFAETDAAKVAPGQTAAVTFDAIGGLALPAHVLAVAPNSTVTSNVVNYLITFTLDRSDPRIRSGMTANVTVIVNAVSNTLSVANSALHRSGRTTSVVLLRNGRQESVEVTLGLIGDTSSQVVAGLNSGDKVVLPTVSVGGGGNTRGTGAGGILGPGGFGGGGRGPGG